MNRIGVLTSGGDSPGMNACIRSVVRHGMARGMEVIGYRRGYEGLIDNDGIRMTSRSVSGIMQTGGTILQTARSKRFLDPDVRAEMVQRLKADGLDGLVVVGGNGSFRGAVELVALGMPVAGVPASIDNDIGGTDMAVGVDTCLNTIISAVDKIKDTAGSLPRPFIIEVMGRKSGYLALLAGLACGAEMLVIPEEPVELQALGKIIVDAYHRGKSMFICLVSEGATVTAREITDYLKLHIPPEGGGPRLSILGYIQRGGSPSAFDRILATRMGVAAVNALADGQHSHMVGLNGNRITATPFLEAAAVTPTIEPGLSEMAVTLSQ